MLNAQFVSASCLRLRLAWAQTANVHLGTAQASNCLEAELHRVASTLPQTTNAHVDRRVLQPRHAPVTFVKRSPYAFTVYYIA